MEKKVIFISQIKGGKKNKKKAFKDAIAANKKAIEEINISLGMQKERERLDSANDRMAKLLTKFR